MFRVGICIICALLLAMPVAGGVSAASDAMVRVVVVDDAPPMSYRDTAGTLTGFSVEIARALCHEIRANCRFQSAPQKALVDLLARGQADMIAVGMYETPEREGKLLFTRPHYRSLSLWLGRAGVAPGQVGVRVLTVAGTVQDRYARKHGWAVLAVPGEGELAERLIDGSAQAALVPMGTAIQLQKSAGFRHLGLLPTVIRDSELSGDASFAISLFRPDLKEEMDEALVRIKRNGVYDRINSRFLPFRVS